MQEWNPSVELGLTVYGHRTKGDCNDIETIIPVGKIDKNRVIKTVMGIKPKGKTPISRSLRKVAEEIKYTEEKANIILISDGKETCDPDPCGTAKELEAQGIDFVTHVIGFNVDKKRDKQLECIANATGGEYFSAKNAAALNEAMKVIVKKVEVVKPKPSPIGKYILVSTYNDFKKETPFEIKSGKVSKVHVIFEQFRIETKCTDMNAKVNYEVYASSGRMVYDAQKPCSQAVQLTLDGGDYMVEASIGNDKKEEKFTIGGGESKLLIKADKEFDDMSKELDMFSK